MLSIATKLGISILALLLVGACTASQVSASADEARMEEVSKEANQAVMDGNYEKAIELALPYAKDGDPEALFTVGMMMLEWIEDSTASSKPEFSVEEALSYVRRAASAGVPQAAGLLRAGYQFGRYSLPQDEELARCWRSVERAQKRASECH